MAKRALERLVHMSRFFHLPSLHWNYFLELYKKICNTRFEYLYGFTYVSNLGELHVLKSDTKIFTAPFRKCIDQRYMLIKLLEATT
jgi:hypothetical protein